MEFGQQYFAIAVVLSLLGAALWWLRRRGYAAPAMGPRGARRLETLERLPLSPQHTLHLVRAGDETLLLACSPAGCSLVRELGRPGGGAR